VSGVVSISGFVPFSEEFDWYAGMIAPGGMRAAREGRAARARYAETAEFDENSFTEADHAALAGPWESLAADAGHAGATWPDGLIDDDVAFARPWGFAPGDVAAPVLAVHGGEDRVVPVAHGERLARECPRGELWLRPRAGHISILDACPLALDWLAAHAGAAG
jgi:pimeloyl-ACP methyl ester carboxylesterase